MVDVKFISVFVVYALPDKQEVITIQVPIKCNVGQAIEISGIMQKYGEIDLLKNSFGIYGKIVQLDQVLQEHDRVEIYRPLIVDPMQARRARADLQKEV